LIFAAVPPRAMVLVLRRSELSHQEDRMSNGIRLDDRRPSLTRREFTLEAALAVLAGCVITISDACGGSKTAPTAPPADITGSVADNHGHTAVITGAQITAGNAVSLNIQGQATHAHTLSLTQGDLGTLKNRQPVSSTSSTDSFHSHVVTFTPV
jgi:hypothetical protein